MNKLPLPEGLLELVENIVDQAMEQRPDLIARLAEVKKARAKLWLPFSQGSSLGNQYRRNVRTNPPGNGSYSASNVVDEAMLTMEWTLFDGFEHNNAVHKAKARNEASKGQLETLRLEIMRDIWKAYATTQGSHTQGFSAVIELLSAQKDLARFRHTEIDSHASLLRSAATLVYVSGGQSREDLDSDSEAFGRRLT